MRIAIDTGGTFTDLVVPMPGGSPRIYKSPTTPDCPGEGMLNAIALAAEDAGKTLREFLGGVELIVHGTTHALNAVVTGNHSKTALLVTKGHSDILTLREGGKIDPFDVRVEYPRPFIPRSHTFEIKERVIATGEVLQPLDEGCVDEVIDRLVREDFEAVAICFLWSIVNGSHEARVAELIRRRLPDLPVTLSHQLNPCVREFRRASSTAIDASLKPIMSEYMSSLEGRLQAAGFKGALRVVTSLGGTMRANEIRDAPIYALNSGPAMAPIMGRSYTAGSGSAVVIDTGGTTFDISLVRNGTIPWTRSKWIGLPIEGLMTGFPSVDVQSISDHQPFAKRRSSHVEHAVAYGEFVRAERCQGFFLLCYNMERRSYRCGRQYTDPCYERPEADGSDRTGASSRYPSR